jgi:hypothetical protein
VKVIETHLYISFTVVLVTSDGTFRTEPPPYRKTPGRCIIPLVAENMTKKASWLSILKNGVAITH